MLERTLIILFMLVLPLPITQPVHAQENIDEMLAVVERNVITQSDVSALSLLNLYHVPDTNFLYERSAQAPVLFLVELKILNTLASAVPIYNLSADKENYILRLLAKINAENRAFPFPERIHHWLRAQLIAENYVRINLGLSKTNTGSLSAYVRWMEQQKKRVSHRIVHTEQSQ